MVSRSEEQCGDNNVVVLCDLQSSAETTMWWCYVTYRAVRRQQCGGAM